MNNELNNNTIKKFSGLNICPNEGSKNQKTEYQGIQKKITAACKWQQISKSQQKRIKAKIGEEIIELYEVEQIELNEKILKYLEDLKDWQESERKYRRKKIDAIDEMKEWKKLIEREVSHELCQN